MANIVVGVKVDTSQGEAGFKSLSTSMQSETKNIANTVDKANKSTQNWFTSFSTAADNIYKKTTQLTKPFVQLESSAKKFLGLFVGNPLASLLMSMLKITALIGVFKLLRTGIAAIGDAIVKVSVKMAAAFNRAFMSMREVVGTGFIATLARAEQESATKLDKILFKINKVFKETFGQDIPIVLQNFAEVLDRAITGVDGHISFLSSRLQNFRGRLTGLFGDVRESAERVTDTVTTQASAFADANPEVRIFAETVRMTADSAQGFVGAVGSITAGIEQISGPIGQATGRVMQFINSIGGLRTLAIAGAALTAGFAAISSSVVFATNNVKRLMEQGGQIDDLSQRMGVTSEEFQKMSFMAEKAGVTVEDLAKSSKKLGMNAYEAATGNKELAKYFDILGVSVKNTDGTMKSQNEILKETLISISKLPEGTQRQAIAQKLLGKTADELAPLYNEGAKAIENYFSKGDNAVVMSNELATASAELGDSVLVIQQAGKKMLNSFFEPLMIYLDDLFKKMVASSGGTEQLNKKLMLLGQSFVDVLNVGVNFVEMFIDLGKAINDNKNIILVLTGLLTTYAIVTNAAAVGTGLLTVGTKIATLAQTAWNAVLSMNPLGAVLLAVTALTAGIYAYSDAVDKALDKQADFFGAEADQVGDVIDKVKRLNELRSKGLSGMSRNELKEYNSISKTIKDLTGQTVKWDNVTREHVLLSGGLFAKGATTTLQNLETQMKAATINAEKAAKEAAETAKDIDAAEGAQAAADKAAAAAKARAEEAKKALEDAKQNAKDRLKLGLDLAKQYDEAILQQTLEGRLLLLERQAVAEEKILRESGMNEEDVRYAVADLHKIIEQKKTAETKASVDAQKSMYQSYLDLVKTDTDFFTEKTKISSDRNKRLEDAAKEITDAEQLKNAQLAIETAYQQELKALREKYNIYGVYDYYSDSITDVNKLEKEALAEHLAYKLTNALSNKEALLSAEVERYKEQGKMLDEYVSLVDETEAQQYLFAEQMLKQHNDNMNQIEADAFLERYNTILNNGIMLKDAVFGITDEIANGRQKAGEKELEKLQEKHTKELESSKLSARGKKALEAKQAAEMQALKDKQAREEYKSQTASLWINSFINQGKAFAGAVGQFGFPAGPIIGGGLAAAILAQTIIAQANAKKYGFEDGGIVPGNSMRGDNVPVNVNSREAILTMQQQKVFMDIANGKRDVNNNNQPITIQINGDVTNDKLSELEDLLYSLQSGNRLGFLR